MTAVVEPFTDWILAIGVDTVTAVIQARGLVGPFQYQLYVQYCDVRTNKPGAWTSLDALQTASTTPERCTGSLSVSTGAQFYLRFGIGYNSTTGGTLAQADVILQVSYDARGQLIGMTQIHATATTTDVRNEAVTAFVPTHAAGKVKAVMIATGIQGNGFQFRLCKQNAATSQENPSTTWDLLEAGWHTGASNQEINTTELSLTFTNIMWVRFGVAYGLASGTYGDAMISIAVMIRP